MNSSQFKKNEFKRLCATIAFRPSQIEQVVANIDDYYQEWTEKKVDKKTGQFKKYQDGTLKKRTISPSIKELKIIQKNIKNNILAHIELPKNVHGGLKKRSNITNAKPHQGNKYQFTTDLQDFYPNISSKQVYDSLIRLAFSPHYASWLTKLTTWKYKLPQGAPSSTHIANIVFLETDLRLIELCNEHSITYTRFVDDLTFSSQQDFQDVIPELLNLVLSNNFSLSYRKTKYTGNQNITGVDVYLNKIDAPSDIIAKAKTESESMDSIKSYSNYLKNIRATNRPHKGSKTD